MDKFVWEDKYSVGIPSLDEQHKRFFGIADNIIDMLERKEFNEAKLSELLEQLVTHGLIHFRTEEAYFDKFNYPSAPVHIETHKSYNRKINNYVQVLKDRTTDVKTLAEEVAGFAIYWLSDHILLMDKLYTVFLTDRGVK